MRRLWVPVGMVLAFLLALFLLAEIAGLPILRDPSPWLHRGGPPAALLGVGLLVADLLLPVPSSLVMISLGALFGVAWGAALSLAGSVGAALAGFAIGRRGDPLLARLVAPAERAAADRLLSRWGGLAIAVTRPVPLLADAVVILAGASPLGWGQAALAAALGSLPPALLYAVTGATAASLRSGILAFGVMILVAGLFWLLGRRALGDRLFTVADGGKRNRE